MEEEETRRQCVPLEGDSMHSMTTNDGRFYDKYDKFRPNFSHMKNMTRQGYEQPPIGQIYLHGLHPTHLSGLVTLMTRVFLFMLQFFPQFEWLPLTPKFDLLVTIFTPDMSYFHMSEIRSEFVILFIESSIICCHRVHKISFQVSHLVFQSLPFPWELPSFTNSNYLDNYIIFDTT